MVQKKARGAGLVGAVAVLAVAAYLALPGTPGAPSRASANSGSAVCGTQNVQILGFSEALNKQSFGGFDITELSGIAYDRMTGGYVAVADRAGAIESHVFTLGIPLTDETMSDPVITSVTVLKQPSGSPYNGFNFDGEGIALAAGGQVRWVSSEGGSAAGRQPEIRAFTRDGVHIAALEVPAIFLIGTNNLSFESLAISPNGRSLFTVNEGPLPADGRTAALESRVRILRYEDHGPMGYEPVEQYFYLSEPGRTTSDLGVVEIIALTEEDILVMERGFVANQGNTVRVFRVSLEGAADVSAVPSLAAPGLEPVSKEMVFDLAECPSDGATTPPDAVQPNPLLDNFEAMTLGPVLPDGRRALILVSDDNGSAVQTTRVVALALSLPELVGQD